MTRQHPKSPLALSRAAISCPAALRGGTALATVLAAAWLAGLPDAAPAQDAAGPVTTLRPIEVEGDVADDDEGSILADRVSGGSRMSADVLDTAASISVITAEEIRRRDAQSVEEVLQYSPGVVTDIYGSDDRFDFFRIRGFGAWTYRDGLPLGSSFGGIREEVYAFERVEVVKGGNSTAFGISDPGGSVNYITKTPRGGRHGEITGSYGSHDRKEVGFDVGGDLTEDGTLSWRFTGKLRDAEDEYDFSRDDETFLMLGLAWRPTDATTLSFVVDHLHRDGVPGGGGHPVGSDFPRNRFFGEPSFNYRGTDRTVATLMLDHDFGNGLTFGSTLRWTDQATDFGYAYIGGSAGGTVASRSFFANDSGAESVQADARLQYDTGFGAVDSRTLLGIEASTSDSRTTTWFTAAPDIDTANPVYTGGIDLSTLAPFQSRRTEQETTALYLQQELTFSDTVIATAGVRHDWLDITQTDLLTGTTTRGDYSETTARAGLTWKIRPDLSVYGSYSQSVVPASLTVEPERGEQYELGVKYRPEGSRALFTAAVYDLTKNNITRTNPATGLQDTIGEVRVRGIDLEAKVEMMRNVSLTAAWSWLDSEIVENGTGGNIGNEVSFVPDQVGSLWVSWLVPGAGTRGDMTFGLGARYTGGYWFDDANTQRTGDAVVLDAAWSWDVREDLQLNVNIQNLLDEKHVAYGGFGADFHNPGRTVNATLRHTW